MNVTVLNEKSPEIGEIIGIYDYNVLIFGVYLGYTKFYSEEYIKINNIDISNLEYFYDSGYLIYELKL